MFTGWIKLAVVLAGAATVSGIVAVVGLPSNLVGTPPAVNASITPNGSKSADSPAAAAQAAPGALATADPGPAPANPLAPPVTSRPGEPAHPVFDIVRVEPTGKVVVAGRGEPGSTIELLRNGTLHDKTTVSPAGHFALVPPQLAAGTHELTLLQSLNDGSRTPSRQSVTVSVRAQGAGPAMVALATPDRPTEILSAGPAGPRIATAALPPVGAATGPGRVRPTVELVTVEAEEGGRMYATGSALPGATVRLYLNDSYLATATASGEGKWSFTIARGLEPGAYRVRVDDVEPASGRVLSRAEVPFAFSPRAPVATPGSPPPAVAAAGPSDGAMPVPTGAGTSSSPAGLASSSTQVATASPADVVIPEVRTTIVARGDSLWRISKQVYGRGLRYTVIYDANQPQIQDPDRIFPGQLFVLPSEKQP